MPSLKRRSKDVRACGHWMRCFQRLFTQAELCLWPDHAGKCVCRAWRLQHPGGSSIPEVPASQRLQHPGMPQLTTSRVRHRVTDIGHLEQQLVCVCVSGCPSPAINSHPRAHAAKQGKLPTAHIQHPPKNLGISSIK